MSLSEDGKQKARNNLGLGTMNNISKRDKLLIKLKSG
jgi:hypothetical protein